MKYLFPICWFTLVFGLGITSVVTSRIGREDLGALFAELLTEGTALLAVTHDEALVGALADDVLALHGARPGVVRRQSELYVVAEQLEQVAEVGGAPIDVLLGV